MSRTKQPRRRETGKRLTRIPGSRKWYIYWSEGRRSRRKSTGTEDENEARRILERELAADTRPDEGEERIDRLLAFYLDHKRKEYYSNTDDPNHHKQFRSLDHSVQKVFNVFGELRVSDITAHLIRQYIESERYRGMKNGTIRKRLAILRAALNLCKKEGVYIGEIPLYDLPPADPPREEIMTEEEFKQFMEAPAAPHVQLFCMMMAHTLKRPSAILQLQWSWGVDFEKRLINFQRPGLRQTKKKRTPSPINPRLLEALLGAKEKATTDHVVEFMGKPVKDIKKGFKTKAKNAGLPWVVAYSLRHTGASLLAMRGVPMADISEMLGSDEATVRHHYRKFQPEYLRDSSSVLELILN